MYEHVGPERKTSQSPKIMVMIEMKIQVQGNQELVNVDECQATLKKRANSRNFEKMQPG